MRSLLSTVIGLGSLFWIVISTMRWFFVWPDMSQWMLSMMIGLGGLYVAYDQWFKGNMTIRVKDIKDQIDAFEKFFRKERIKDEWK